MIYIESQSATNKK